MRKKMTLADGAGERRSSDTYLRLIDATVAEVFEHGYAGATMTRIAARAGLTRGAIQHHFGDRRVDIITIVTQHILSLRQSAYSSYYDRVRQGHPTDTRASMKAAYRDPATWFLIEVWIACKSDKDLKEKINEISKNINDDDLSIIFPHASMTPEKFRVLKYFLRSLTRGIAIENSIKKNENLFDDVVDFALSAINMDI